jgi:undecaprenyl-diphosphatase
MSNNLKKIFFLTSLVLGSIFIFLSYLVQKDVFRDIDYESMMKLQNSISRQVDISFSYLTLLGSAEFTGIIVGAIFLIGLWKYKRLFLSIFLFFLIFLIEYAGKMFIFHPDPPNIFNRYALGLRLPSSFVVKANYSFPSGHVARTTFLTVIFLFFILTWRTSLGKKLTFLILLVSFLSLVLVSRVYLGEHWLSDVVGGFLLGASISTLAVGLW